jgi:hypothetical protein
MTTIYRGDDTDAFGNTFITIYLNGAEGKEISKAIFRCGDIQKSYTRPTFPIRVNFSAQETAKLYKENECYLQVFDRKGRRKTCKGELVIPTKSST